MKLSICIPQIADSLVFQLVLFAVWNEIIKAAIADDAARLLLLFHIDINHHQYTAIQYKVSEISLHNIVVVSLFQMINNGDLNFFKYVYF